MSAATPAASAGQGGVGLLWGMLLAHRRTVIAGVATGIAWSLIKLSIPIFVRYGIDLGIRAHDMRQLMIAVGGIALFGIVGAALAGLRRYLAQSAAFRIEADLRAKLFVHILRLDLGFHARSPSGVIVSRATSDLQQIQQPFVNIPLTASNAMMFIGASTILVLTDPLLAACAMGPALLVFLFARRFNTQLGPRAVDLQRSIGLLAGLVTDAVTGVRAIKGLGLVRLEQERAAAQAAIVYDAAIRLSRVRATFLPLLDVLPALGLASILWIGGQRVAAGGLTIGELIQFNYYVLMLVGPLRHAGITVAQFQRAFVSAGLIDALFRIQPGITDGSSSLTDLGARGEIRFEGVVFGYGDGPPLLSKLDLTIAAGETVAIVGASGSGKTSLAGLIARLHDVSAGRITIDGIDVRDARLADLRTQVGMVFEDAFLFSGSVRDNIAFARPGALNSEIEAAAQAAGAHDFIIALDGGYHARVGERGYSLSGGQRQRIALARALLAQPRILVLDAAISAIDAAKEEEIRDGLGASLKGRTTILVAHRPATLRTADRVLLLHGGRIAASGSHDELLRSNADYRRVLASVENGTSRQEDAA